MYSDMPAKALNRWRTNLVTEGAERPAWGDSSRLREGRTGSKRSPWQPAQGFLPFCHRTPARLEAGMYSVGSGATAHRPERSGEPPCHMLCENLSLSAGLLL